jgi:AraC-like DNA-binding protein
MPETIEGIPVKYLSRKEEITAAFLALMDSHVIELVAGTVQRRMAPSEFGARLFIHPRHLTNTIKLTTCKSPCDFVEERLLAESQKLLLDTNLSIGDISARFGYTEPTNFIKFFKGMCGTTPLQYRKAMLAASNI